MSARERPSGLLGRGPFFWAGLFFVSSAALGLLAATGAIEGRGTILVLVLVPVALLFAVFRAAQLKIRAKQSSGSRKGVAQAAYIKRVAMFTSFYLASVALFALFDARVDVPYVIRLVIALLPGLAVIGFFWAVGRLIIEEQDEFLRMLTVRQTLVATAIALSAASIWGFLESGDMVPHLDAYWVAVVWFFGLFVGAAANRVEHGTWGSI